MASPARTARLTDLPTELIAKILHGLDYQTLVRSQQVSRAWHCLVKNTATLQYKIALAISGLVDGRPSVIPPAERLEALRARDIAWSRLEWSEESTIEKQRGSVWELYGNVFAQGRDSFTLTFIQLPSVHRKIPRREWQITLDFRIRDFCMDASQDLLVIVEVKSARRESAMGRVHFRTLSTGERHPLGPKTGAVEYTPEGLSTDWSYDIKISGHNVGILYNASGGLEDSSNHMLVFNWTTGETVLRSCSSQFEAFTFLSDRYILLGCLVPVGLWDPEQFALCVYDLAPCAAAQPHAFTLELPEADPAGLAGSISIRADPSPTWVPGGNLGVPFHAAPEDRVLVIEYANSRTMLSPALLQFVLLSSLLAALPVGVSGGDGTDDDEDEDHGPVDLDGLVNAKRQPRRVPWAAWGPHGSRMMLLPTSGVWVCHVFGTRFASPRMGRQRNHVSELAVFDFNPVAFRHGAAAAAARARGEGVTAGDGDGDAYGKGWMYVDEPKLIGPRVFAQPVRTELPYRWTRRAVPPQLTEGGRYFAVMLSEDSIILVDVGGLGSGNRRAHLLTF